MYIYFSIKVSIILPKCFVTPSQKHFGSIILTLIAKYMCSFVKAWVNQNNPEVLLTQYKTYMYIYISKVNQIIIIDNKFNYIYIKVKKGDIVVCFSSSKETERLIIN